MKLGFRVFPDAGQRWFCHMLDSGRRLLVGWRLRWKRWRDDGRRGKRHSWASRPGKRHLRGRWRREYHRVREPFNLFIQLLIGSAIPRVEYGLLSGG